jgi:hypothetical protein
MRKNVVPLLVIVVVVAIILGGCAAPAAAPATTPPTTSPPATPTTAPPSGELTFPWENCFAKPDGTPYRVVFITDQAANLPMIMHTQHDQGIIEKGGGEWTLFSADMDVAKQSSALEDQLIAKPDAIILHPVAADTTIPYVEQWASKDSIHARLLRGERYQGKGALRLGYLRSG